MKFLIPPPPNEKKTTFISIDHSISRKSCAVSENLLFKDLELLSTDSDFYNDENNW